MESMVKITNEKRLPSTIRNPWIDAVFSPWMNMSWIKDMEATIDQISENFERMYDMFPNYMRQFPKDVSCDLADMGDKYVITADLPGIENDDVKVNISGRQVEISAEHKDTREERTKDLIKNERSFVKYQRVLTVPQRVTESGTIAKMNNGVLTLELPKKSSLKKESPPQTKAP